MLDKKAYGPSKRGISKPYPLKLEAIENRRNRIVVNEYLPTIRSHLRDMELNSEVNLAMIDLQPEVKWFMRPYLVNFLIQMHSSLKLKPQTLFLCWNIIDRYCAKRIAFKQHYQLIGCTALWIAAKYEDKKSRVPTVTELSLMCSNVYDESMFKEMEIHILSTLNWSLGHTTLEDILQLSIKVADHDGKEKLNKPLDQYKSNSPTVSAILAISRYICELSLYERSYLNFKNSLIGITAHLIACSILGLNTGVKSLETIYYQYQSISNAQSSSEKFQQLPTPVTPSKEFEFFYDNDENDELKSFDSNIENKDPTNSTQFGPFIQGFEGEETIEQLRIISLMLLKSILSPPEVLIEKYSQLGVITVIRNFIEEKNLNKVFLNNKEFEELANLSSSPVHTELSNLILNLNSSLDIIQQEPKQPSHHSSDNEQFYQSPILNKSSSSPFNSPSNFSSFSSISSQTTYDSNSFEEFPSISQQHKNYTNSSNNNNGNINSYNTNTNGSVIGTGIPCSVQHHHNNHHQQIQHDQSISRSQYPNSSPILNSDN